jgi:hypothetical protein
MVIDGIKVSFCFYSFMKKRRKFCFVEKKLSFLCMPSDWDGREPPMGPPNVTGTRVIFFIRHGHYEYSIPEEKIEMTELG